jgi:hypothetical protein
MVGEREGLPHRHTWQRGSRTRGWRCPLQQHRQHPASATADGDPETPHFSRQREKLWPLSADSCKMLIIKLSEN